MWPKEKLCCALLLGQGSDTALQRLVQTWSQPRLSLSPLLALMNEHTGFLMLGSHPSVFGQNHTGALSVGPSLGCVQLAACCWLLQGRGEVEEDMVSVNLFTRMFTIMETLCDSDRPCGDSWIEQQHLITLRVHCPCLPDLPLLLHCHLVLLLEPKTGLIPML